MFLRFYIANDVTIYACLKCVRIMCLQDELWGNCSKKIKLDPSSSMNGNTATTTVPTDASNNSGGALEYVIRRSARNKRPRGEMQIVVSSNDTLLELKMKVREF